MFAGEREQFRERRKVTVHGKYTIGCDQRAVVLGAMRSEELTHVRNIIVTEGHHRSTRQLCASINAGMRQLVEQNETVLADQHRDDAGIGEVAGTEYARRLGALELCQPRFKLRIERMIACHESRSP